MGHQAPDSFFLTSGSKQPPIVHGIFNPSTRIWQYVVADPTGDKCVVIDPMLDQSDQVLDAASKAADQLFELVEQHKYRVTHILETRSTSRPTRSASWALRMQFLQKQGFAPDMCSTDTVDMMHKKYERQYGSQSGFSTTLSAEHADGEQFLVGRMRVTVLQIPGPRTPNRRAYLIGDNVFGAHSVADLKPEDLDDLTTRGQDGVSILVAEEEDYCLHRSMQRVLSLPGTVRAYNEEGDESCESFTPPFTTIDECRTKNEYADMSPREFAQRRRGEFSMAVEKREMANKPSKRRWRFGKSSRSEQVTRPSSSAGRV